MRKLFKELFYVPKYGKVREKTMLAQVVATVTIIVICLAAMSFTAYAYFSHNVSSSHNIIKSANFETNVKIQIKTNTGETIPVITSNYKSHIANLQANTTYFLTLIPTERSTARTGFVIVTAEGCEDRYHTEQLGVVGDSYTHALTFYLVPSADTKVTFLAHWGTSSFYGYEDTGNELYIKQDETVNISITETPDTSEPTTTPVVTVPTDPTVTAPTVTEPTVTAPTVTEPTVTAPTVTAPTVTEPTVTVPTVTAPTVTEPTETTPVIPNETVHTVKSGETLADIAGLYGTTIDQLATYNELADINALQIGQMLRIPQSEEITPEATTPPATEETAPAVTTSPTTEEAASSDPTQPS